MIRFALCMLLLVGCGKVMAPKAGDKAGAPDLTQEPRGLVDAPVSEFIDAAQSDGYRASVRHGIATIRFTDNLDRIHGPFKFYVGEFTVEPTQVYQKWTNNQWVEASFPISAVGGQEQFDFIAVTIGLDPETGTQVEWFVLSGSVPN